VIKGGEEPYIVPEHAEARVDIRVPTLDEQRRLELGIQTLGKETAIGGTKTLINGGFHRPPMEPCGGTTDLEEVIQSAGALLGSKVTFTTSPRGGATDGNLVAAAGTPCVDGMGVLGGGAHTAQEFTVVSSMFEKAKLAALVLDALF
jgi:glutamate carboxypeptidase